MSHPRAEGRRARSGIEVVYQDLALARQPRRRPEHVPGPRGARRRSAGSTRSTWRSARAETLAEPVGHDDPLRAPDRRRPVRRPAPVRRGRQGRACGTPSSSSSTSRPRRSASRRPARCSTSSSGWASRASPSCSISHNLHDVFEVADTITVLRLGQNVAEFKRKDVTQTRSSRPSPPASCRRCPASRGGDRVSATAHPAETRPRRGSPRGRGQRPSRDGDVRALVGGRPRRRPRLAADLRRPDHHRDRLPVAELELPDRGQLRQPHRPDGGDHDRSAWASCSSCCSGRSTCRSASSAAWPASSTALLLLDDGNAVGRRPRDRRRARRGRGDRRRCTGCSSRRSGSRRSSSRSPACWPGTAWCCCSSATAARSIIQNDLVIGFANDFLPTATAWIVLIAVRRALRGERCWAAVAARKARAADRARSCSIAPAGRRAARGRGAIVVAVRQPGPRHPVRARWSLAVLLRVLDVRAQPDEVRPPHLRGRRQHRGGAARGHQRRPHQDRRVRDLLDDGGARRHHPRLAPALGGHERGRRPILLYSIAAAVIGGTSLFGGRGHIKSAVLGALVIASIDNGLGLLGLSSGTKFVITGLVLLLAVTVDSLSRRRRRERRSSVSGWRAALGLLSTARINRRDPRRRRGLPTRWTVVAVAVARRAAARRSTPRERRSRAPTAPTRSCWPTTGSTPCTSRCPTGCTRRGRVRGAGGGQARAVREAGGAPSRRRSRGCSRRRRERGLGCSTEAFMWRHHAADAGGCASSSRRARSASCG